MTIGRTARNVPQRELLPVIARFLRDCGASNPIYSLRAPQSSIAKLEDWILNQLANVLYQLYLFPSIVIPGFAVRRGCSAGEQKVIKGLHQVYIGRLVQAGWLVKDVSGIVHLSEWMTEKIEELARSVCQ
jgi:hypothetical protein